MRVGIDNISPGESSGPKGPGGMRAYLRGLVTEMAGRAPHHQFVLLTPDWAAPLAERLPSNVEVVAVRGVPVSRMSRTLYQQTMLPAVIVTQRLDVFFATATIAPLLCPTPVALAVQFTQFFRWPEAFGWSRTAYLRLMLPLSLRKAGRAIIFTEAAKADLVRWTGVAPGKVHVVPHALSPDLWRLVAASPATPPVGSNGLTGRRPSILYVSATYGYKNHARLIQAFGLLKQRLNVPHVLVLIGDEVTVSFETLRDVARRAGVADQVIFTGRIDPYDRVVAAYLGADLAVVPTLYETFGYPVLEALACGCPLVTSRDGSMAELAGDAAVLVDPLNIEDIAGGMARVLIDRSLREHLIARGRERARAYTWDRVAPQTLAILEEAATP